MNVREKKVTLEDLLVQKQELKKQIESQQQKLVESYYLLTEPYRLKRYAKKLKMLIKF